MTDCRFALVCALALAASLPGAAQPACTQDMIRGTWVDTITGFLLVTPPGGTQAVPVPGVTLGIFKIDSQGHIAATGTVGLPGQIGTGVIAGTIQVNPDCTATAPFTMQLPGMPALPGVETLVIVDHGNEMWAMPVQEPLGGGVTLETLRRISTGDPQCSNSTVVGAFGTNYQGYAMVTPPGQTQPTPAPFSYVGKAAIDYQGRVSGGGTYSVGGTIMNVTLANAALQINPDCTGTLQYNLVPAGSKKLLPGQGIDQFVVLSNGDEIVPMMLQSPLGGPVALGSMKRISRVF